MSSLALTAFRVLFAFGVVGGSFAEDGEDETVFSSRFWVVLVLSTVVFILFKYLSSSSLPKARALHILVNTEAECQRLKQELEREQDPFYKFQDLAKQHSSCPSGKSGGGDLGEFQQGVMDPVFDRAVFQTGEVGKVTGPVRTNFGYHLIYIITRDDKKAS